ncbi:unnamed protein product [Ilex paraguariensis]|uniref:Phytocyanin domain-containing protein n=1 Tax=Ilex paraguariensis TaxID=185542 RepID=A0ABC8UAI2_9AQUA
MGCVRTPRYHLCYIWQLFLLIQSKAFCYQYKVGDLDAWGIPTSANPQVYNKWSKNHKFKIGDSLMFLYPPSQDSLIQVTEDAYKSCNLKYPILYMNNGNSLFNVTSPGEFYFTSGVQGHCGKSQKLHISVPGNGTSAFSPSYGPGALPATSPSYPTVFGSIPTPPSSSSSSSLLKFPAFMEAAIGFFICAFISGRV